MSPQLSGEPAGWVVKEADQMTNRLNTQQPNPNSDQPVSRVVHRTLFCILACSSVLSGGCSKEDTAKAAAAEAEKAFWTVSVGDPTFSDEFSEDAYNLADDATNEFSGGDDVFGEAASIAHSLAKLGLATLQGDAASESETAAMHKSRVIRGFLSEWISMNAVAEASTGFDITDERTSLRSTIKLRENDVSLYTDRYNAVRAEIDAYQLQIDELDSKSIIERNESAQFELQMTSVTATRAAQLAERVREHSLRADGFELESVRLQGLVGQLLPGAHEVKLQVQMAKDQIKLLQLSIDELEQRVRDSKADSAKARAKAQEAQSRITALVKQLEDFRASDTIPASERVISTIRQSIRASATATKNAKTSGSIAKSSGQEQLARSLSRQSRGESEMMLLYQSIEHAGLPGQWKPLLDEHESRSNQLKEEAMQSFQDAASSLRRVRSRGSSADALEAAAVRLDRLGGIEPEPDYTEEYEDDSEFDDSETFEDTQADPEAEEIDEEG